MDGLIIKINDNFLKTLEARGLRVKSLRIRFFIKERNRQGNKYILFPSLSEYNSFVSNILNSEDPLLFFGDLPIIDNIELENKNLKFKNEYNWYNITGNRYMIKKLDYDSFRSDFYDKEIVRYENLTIELLDRYIKDVTLMDRGGNSYGGYVDVGYVDPGYVAP